MWDASSLFAAPTVLIQIETNMRLGSSRSELVQLALIVWRGREQNYAAIRHCGRKQDLAPLINDSTGGIGTEGIGLTPGAKNPT